MTVDDIRAELAAVIMLLYEPLFRALNASGTRYVVVGGVATVLHGYARLKIARLKGSRDEPREDR